MLYKGRDKAALNRDNKGQYQGQGREKQGQEGKMPGSRQGKTGTRRDKAKVEARVKSGEKKGKQGHAGMSRARQG